MEEKSFNSVGEALDGQVILVGEDHRSRRCGRLAKRVIDQVDPQTLAVERAPFVSPKPAGRVAMGEATQYAKENGLPLLHIDSRDKRRKFDEAVDNRGEFLKVANHFEDPVTREGEVTINSIISSRSKIRHQFGQEAYEALYIEREIDMARHLIHAVERFEPPIVAAVGAFHVKALEEMLEVLDEGFPIDEQGINYTAASAEATPETAD